MDNAEEIKRKRKLLGQAARHFTKQKQKSKKHILNAYAEQIRVWRMKGASYGMIAKILLAMNIKVSRFAVARFNKCCLAIDSKKSEIKTAD